MTGEQRTEMPSNPSPPAPISQFIVPHRRGRMMPLALVEKSCTPCRGGMPPLTQEEAANYGGQAPDWELLDGAKRIARTYRFKNFREAFAFVERAAALAETERLHHGGKARSHHSRGRASDGLNHPTPSSTG